MTQVEPASLGAAWGLRGPFALHTKVAAGTATGTGGSERALGSQGNGRQAPLSGDPRARRPGS